MTENPNKSPSSLLPPTKHSRTKTIGSILILLAMLPAAGIACFTICLAVVAPLGPDEFFTGVVFGVVGSVVVAALMLWWAFVLTRPKAVRPSAELPRRWTKMDCTCIDATFVSITENEVNLIQVDGTELRIPLTQLSVADRVWLEVRH